MKKSLIIIIFVGMVGWTLFDTIDWNSDSETSAGNKETSNEYNDNAPITEEDIGLDEGDYAPDFSLETLEGDEVSLSDYRGQQVMINFWATWCPPCRAEMPDMQEVYESHDIEILAINLTETETSIGQVETFTEDFGLTFPILLDHEIEVADLYEIQPIPSSFLIDSEGRVQSIAFGALNKDMIIQKFANMD